MAGGSERSIPRPERTVATPLWRLAGRGVTLERGGDVQVTGVTAAAGRVQPGDLFAAAQGATVHGAQFVGEALADGAVAVLTDHGGLPAVPDGVPVLLAPDVRAELGAISATIYADPSSQLSVLGVTGTSGKTTTTFLMRAGLRAAGRVPGMIGTVATMIGDETLQAGFTTPEAPELQALLAVMRERGVTDVAMEVSSHALAMNRVDNVAFDVAGFTNLSEDHLDFHDTMDAYFATKATLFERTSDPLHNVVCRDDSWGEELVQRLGSCTTVETTGGRSGNSTWQAFEIVDAPDGGTLFRLRKRGRPPLPSRPGVAGVSDVEISMGCAIPGRYNVANAAVALAMLAEAGVDPHVAAPAIATASVPGRMERVDVGQPYLAVVDYSHKPAAVDGALRALRPLTRGKLIIVLGCGGDRDRGKRPHMGEIAARGADVLVITDDNPRSEDPAAIRRAMRDGAMSVVPDERAEVLEVGARADAIAAAVGRADAGDTVLVAGKGHETGQEVAGVVHPFDDRIVLRAAIESVR